MGIFLTHFLAHIEHFSLPFDVLLHMMKKIVLAFLVSISFANFCVTTADDRPNILWVVSEDNSHHWLGCYGNEQVSTPNIDQLASEGVRYKFAYSNAPVCAVARSTLITGRYACSIGTQNMRSRYPIPSDIQPFVSYLRDSDYYCVNRSKTDYNFETDDKSHWAGSCRGVSGIIPLFRAAFFLFSKRLLSWLMPVLKTAKKGFPSGRFFQ